MSLTSLGYVRNAYYVVISPDILSSLYIQHDTAKHPEHQRQDSKKSLHAGKKEHDFESDFNFSWSLSTLQHITPAMEKIVDSKKDPQATATEDEVKSGRLAKKRVHFASDHQNKDPTKTSTDKSDSSIPDAKNTGKTFDKKKVLMQVFDICMAISPSLPCMDYS